MPKNYFMYDFGLPNDIAASQQEILEEDHTEEEMEVLLAECDVIED